MTTRRRLLAACSATLALGALSGCEKPAPLVTLVSGDQSVYSEAVVYCFEEDATLETDECAQRAEGPTRLEVRPGEQIGVDVGKDLVERGWRFKLGSDENPDYVSQVFEDQHYFAFEAPPLPGTGALFTVFTSDDEDVPTGEWRLQLVPKD